MISVFISPFVRQKPGLDSAIENYIVLPRVVSAAFHSSGTPVLIGDRRLISLFPRKKLGMLGHDVSNQLDFAFVREVQCGISDLEFCDR